MPVTGPFINKLLDYLHRAAAMNSDYFTNAILNPHWLPPPGFYTGEYDMPDPNDGFLWDDVDSNVFSPLFDHRTWKKEGGDRMHSSASLSGVMGATAAEPESASPFPSLPFSLHSVRSSEVGRISRPSLMGEEEYLNDSLLRPAREKNFPNNGIESLVDKMSRWKTYAQDHRDEPGIMGTTSRASRRRQRHDRQRGLVWEDEDSADDSSVLDLGGRGRGNPFAHLRPRLGGML